MPEINANLTAGAIIESLSISDDFDRTEAAGLGNGYVHSSGGQDAASVNGSYAVVGPGEWESFTTPWSVPEDGYTFQYDFWVQSIADIGQLPSEYVTYYWIAWNSFGSDVYPSAWGVQPASPFSLQCEIWTGDEDEWVFFDLMVDESSWYTYKVHRGGGEYRVKIWKRGDPEPDWQLVTPVGTQSWNYGAPIIELDGVGGTGEGRIDNIRLWSDGLGSTVAHGSFGAGAVLSRTAYVPPVSSGSVDTFTGAQTNLFSHVPDSGPMWISGGSVQGGVVAFDGKWWAYQHGYSEMETHQHDYDITFDYLGYGAVRLYLRFDGTRNAVVFVVGQTEPPSAFGYARITEFVDGSMTYNSNRAGFTLGHKYTIRAVLTGLSAYLYVDGVLAFTYHVTRDLPWTRLKLENITGSGTVIDNWNFPYLVPGTSFWASAEIVEAPTGDPSSGPPPDPYENPLPPSNDIVIRLNGVDITEDVIFESVEFTSQASGSPGTCSFKIKDMKYAYLIVVGQTLKLEINGRNIWGGWVQSVKRQFFFPYTGSPLQSYRRTSPGIGQPRRDPDWDPCGEGGGSGGGGGGGEYVSSLGLVPRALVVEGIDYNILFNKRFLFNKADPPDGILKSWPEDTPDDVMIRWMCDSNLDLSTDGLGTTKLVEHVGTPNPDYRGNPAGGGDKWGDAMRAIARYPGAIWYINPDKQLVYTDVDTVTAAYRLTDTPSGPEDLGYRDMEILYNGTSLVNDAMVWGAGQGANRVKFKRTRDQGSIDAHGLWQVGDFRVDMWKQGTVDKRSRSFVYGSPQNKRGGKDDAISVSVTLFEPAFRVSDKVDFSSHVFDYNDVLPVRRMKVTFPVPDEVQLDLVLSHAIDEPWDMSEYWWPPIPKPIIVIPRTTIPLCPVINPPSNFYDEPGVGMTAIADFGSVFMDNFERASGQPDTEGFWTGNDGQPLAPVIVDGQVNLGNPAYHNIRLDHPVSSSREVILALDLSSWKANSSSRLIVGTDWFSLRATGVATCEWETGRINPARFCGRKVFIRAVRYVGRYTAFRVWPQDQIEPSKWDMTASAVNPPVMSSLLFDGMGTTYLMAISIFGNKLPHEDYAGFWYGPDHNSWRRTWPYSDPDDGWVYAISWGQDSETNLGAGPWPTGPLPEYEYSIAWGYWGEGADHGPGVPSGTTQVISGHWTIFTENSEHQDPPIAIRIEGDASLALGRSKLFDHRGDFPGETSVLFAICGEAIVDGQHPYWFDQVDNPRWGGQEVAYIERVLTWDAPAVVVPFTAYVATGAESSQTGHFRWGVRVYNPLAACREMNPNGGPFMFPNTGAVSIKTSNVKFSGVWRAIPWLIDGGHFCNPNSSGGGLEDERICQSVPIDKIRLQELYRDGELWAVQLNDPYQPGTVEVTVDGMPAKPTLDFIEDDPSSAVITFLNSFSTANEIYVCYIPMGNDVVEPAAPYVPQDEVIRPW